jgi:hypothetical protein
VTYENHSFFCVEAAGPPHTDAAARLQGVSANFSALVAVPTARIGQLRRLDISANCIQNLLDGCVDLVPRLEVCDVSSVLELFQHHPDITLQHACHVSSVRIL